MAHLPPDPFARFLEIYDALNADRSFFQNAASFRFAAIAAATTEGDGATTARAIRRMNDEIDREVGTFGAITKDARLVLAAMLYASGDSVRGFYDQVARVRRMFREHGMRRAGSYETMATWILHRQASGRPVEAATVARMRAIYDGMKSHHWWLTGPDDFPACALLTSAKGEPTAICNRIESIYQALRQEGFSSGDPLQTAANVLHFVGLSPHETARRYARLADEFRRAGIRMWQSDYDELAILCFLEHDATTIVPRVVDRRAQMERLHPKPDHVQTFNLACSVVFLELVQVDRALHHITDAKALTDIQAVVAAQQAAVIAAVTSATAAVTVASSH
ncbi:MAG: DUF4003 family protein [Planctomycetes bacterium]|nr:DUF4003 family protein [Planctomycetota bacterium]